MRQRIGDLVHHPWGLREALPGTSTLPQGVGHRNTQQVDSPLEIFHNVHSFEWTQSPVIPVGIVPEKALVTCMAEHFVRYDVVPGNSKANRPEWQVNEDHARLDVELA